MTTRGHLSIVAVVVILVAGAIGVCRAQGQGPGVATSAPGAGVPGAGEGVRLEELDLSRMAQDWGEAQRNKSVGGKPLTINGVVYKNGVGTHANSEVTIDLHGAATRFSALVGVDDETRKAGAVKFIVLVDDKRVVETPVINGGDAALPIEADLIGAKRLVLQVAAGGDGINSDHADWADATITQAAGAQAKPEAMLPDPGSLDTPEIASGDPEAPAIHGARVVGTTPGRPFLFLVPATGKGPLTFAAEGLPDGLKLDGKTGIITGSVPKAGEFAVQLHVDGPAGKTTAKLRIVAGQHKLALTPPMGWNSWNVWAGAVSADKVKAAADAMVSSGLAAKGFQYINIDDCWEGPRDAGGAITTNQRFPDMKALADYVHARGLKLGIYSSPGPKTCGGYPGSYEHEEQDAKTYAAWGIDYLKYDWCSYGAIAARDKAPEPERLQKPYRVMRAALDKADRDVVYSLCQYGMGNVSAWGGAPGVGGNLWRTTGDITDNWGSMAGIGFRQGALAKFAQPGQWNDPDMLVVGRVGWGPRLHPTKLTPDEQLTHITLWSMLAAPLLIGCDMANMDKFTVDLLTNAEVLAVDQDELGRQAVRKSQDGTTEVWARPLADGSLAVALFNRGAKKAKVTAKWPDLDLTGKQNVRDLWRQKDLGNAEGQWEAQVPGHGAVLVKIGKPVN